MGIWTIMIVTMVASLIIQQVLQSKFNKYSKEPVSNGMTGAQVAEKMLREHGIFDVKVTSTPGMLTDHYNPTTKTVNLSEGVYSSNSVAAAAVAAHECGHAVQHAYGYGPLAMRSALVPVVNLASSLVSWVLLAGVLMIERFPMLIWIGIALFATTTLFSFITLPVEINASKRAIKVIEGTEMLFEDEVPKARKVLIAAAMTYVASLLVSIMSLIRLILRTNRRR